MKKFYLVPHGENDSEFLTALDDFLNNYGIATGVQASLILDDEGQPIILYESYPEPIKQIKKPIEKHPEDYLVFDMLLRGETKINGELKSDNAKSVDMIENPKRIRSERKTSNGKAI